MLFLCAAERFAVNLFGMVACEPFRLKCNVVLGSLDEQGLVAFRERFSECRDFINRRLFFGFKLAPRFAETLVLDFELLVFRFQISVFVQETVVLTDLPFVRLLCSKRSTIGVGMLTRRLGAGCMRTFFSRLRHRIRIFVEREDVRAVFAFDWKTKVNPANSQLRTAPGATDNNSIMRARRRI